VKRNPDLYRATVRVTVYRGPNYVQSVAFRVRIPQEGVVDVAVEDLVERLRQAVDTNRTGVET